MPRAPAVVFRNVILGFFNVVGVAADGLFGVGGGEQELDCAFEFFDAGEAGHAVLIAVVFREERHDVDLFLIEMTEKELRELLVQVAEVHILMVADPDFVDTGLDILLQQADLSGAEHHIPPV